MQGEFNGLKSLTLKESNYAFYVHCLAHQLQLALVAVANRQTNVGCFFILVNKVSNLVGASCKRQEILRESQTHVHGALKNGEIVSGSGLNQNTTLKRAVDTRWSSHFGTLLSLVFLFESVIDVLEHIEECGVTSEQQIDACHLLKRIQSFEFVFNLHMIKTIFGITNDLSLTLQRSGQDIVKERL
jgi:hypothetical protein